MQKILIIEDDIDIQDILKNHLIDAGYEVAIASDGVTGIAMFDDTIALVLLDIMLPKIDGYGVCEVIRKRSQVPIIMLTALSDEENQLRGFEQQIDDYIPKPFSPKILLCKIAAILRRRTTENQNQSLLTYKELSIVHRYATVRDNYNELLPNYSKKRCCLHVGGSNGFVRCTAGNKSITIHTSVCHSNGFCTLSPVFMALYTVYYSTYCATEQDFKTNGRIGFFRSM